MVIPDNYDLGGAHDREQAIWLDSLPKCSVCGEPIQQERAVYIEGFWYCDDCLEYYRREVKYE